MGTDELRHRFLLIGRAMYLSTLWGVLFGAAADVALAVGYLREGGLVWLIFIQAACCVGGLVGAASGAVAGLALAVAGRPATGRLFLARLIVGGAAAVVPLLLAWYLYSAQHSLYARVWPGVVLSVLAAAVTAALFTPRVLDGSPALRGPGVLLPPRWAAQPPAPPVPVATGSAAEFESPTGEFSMPRRLILGRGAGWGIIGGTALGAFTWAAWCVQLGELRPVALIGFAALVGAAVGGCLGLVAGLALAVAGTWAIRPLYRAQLITGGVVTATLLLLLHVSAVNTPWSFVRYLNPSLAVAAALAAVLLTPYVVTGMPARRNGSRSR